MSETKMYSQQARALVMDVLCGYGEAMFLKGNPTNNPDPRVDQKAYWAAYEAAIALAFAEGARDWMNVVVEQAELISAGFAETQVVRHLRAESEGALKAAQQAVERLGKEAG